MSAASNAAHGSGLAMAKRPNSTESNTTSPICQSLANRYKSLSNRCKKASSRCNSPSNGCKTMIFTVTEAQASAKHLETAEIEPSTTATISKPPAKQAKYAEITSRTPAKTSKSSAKALLPAVAAFVRTPKAFPPSDHAAGFGAGAGAGSSLPGRRPRSLMVRACSYLATRSAPASVLRRGRMRSSMVWSLISKAWKVGRTFLVRAALPLMASSGATMSAA